MEDTRKDIPLYAFLDKYVSFRKDENNNKGQNRNKNPAGFFFKWRDGNSLESFRKNSKTISICFLEVGINKIPNHF